MALQRRRTQPINRFAPSSRITGERPVDLLTREQGTRPLETSLVYTPRLRTIDYTRACVPSPHGQAPRGESHLMVDRNAAVVMYLNQLPPQYSAVVLSPTAAIDPAKAAVLSYRREQQEQLLWLKQQQQRQASDRLMHSSVRELQQEERKSNADPLTSSELEMNHLQTTGCPVRRDERQQRCMATGQSRLSSGVNEAQTSTCVTIVPSVCSTAKDSVSFSSFGFQTSTTPTVKRCTSVVDATTSTTVDDIIFDDNRSIYCTRAALDNLLKTGNYIACHVIPSNADAKVAREGAYSEVNITENPYQSVTPGYEYSGARKTDPGRPGDAPGEMTVRVEQSTLCIYDYDEEDYDEADYQEMKSAIYGKTGKNAIHTKGFSSTAHVRSRAKQSTDASGFHAQIATLGVSSSPSSPCPQSHQRDPTKAGLSTHSPTVSLTTSKHQSPLSQLSINSTGIGAATIPSQSSLSAIISPLNPTPYPIVLIQTLSPVLSTNQTTNCFVSQSHTSNSLDSVSSRASERRNNEKGTGSPPSYSSVYQASQSMK